MSCLTVSVSGVYWPVMSHCISQECIGMSCLTVSVSGVYWPAMSHCISDRSVLASHVSLYQR